MPALYKTLRHAFEVSTVKDFHDNDAINPWMMRHVAWVVGRYHPKEPRNEQAIREFTVLSIDDCLFLVNIMAKFNSLSVKTHRGARGERQSVWARQQPVKRTLWVFLMAVRLQSATIRRTRQQEPFDVTLVVNLIAVPWNMTRHRFFALCFSL